MQHAVEQHAAADAGAEVDADQVVLAPGRAEPPLSPGGRVGVVLHDDPEAGTAPDRLPQRLPSPGQMRREEYGRPVGVDEAGGADADAPDPLPMVPSQLGHHIGDGVLHRLGAGRRRLAAQPIEHLDGLVDDAGRDLGAADVDPDREPGQHARAWPWRVPGTRGHGVLARSAAPIIPARLPSEVTRSSGCGRCVAAGSVRANDWRAGSLPRSPASPTPRPAATTAGSSAGTRVAMPAPSQRPTSASSSRDSGSPAVASAVTIWPVSPSPSGPASAARTAASGSSVAIRSFASRTRAR